MGWILLSLLFMLIGVGAAVYARHIYLQIKKLQPPTVSTEGQEHYYGHRWPPVTELRRKLPRCPGGLDWEIKVTPNDRGDDILWLTLVDVTKAENVATRDFNLTQYRPHGTTWAVFYAQYGSLARKHFDSVLIQPMVDWATATLNKRRAGEVYEYHLGDDTN